MPLLVIVELLAKGGGGLGKALSMTLGKAVISVSAMSFVGKKILDPVFYKVAKSGSREAFLSIILSTLFAMSFITKGIGLSDTLGALTHSLTHPLTYSLTHSLGVFFMTVGFSINVRLLFSKAPIIIAMLLAVITTKTFIIAMLGKIFGISSGTAIRTGLLNAQVGEFAFVALGIAERLGLITPSLCKLLLTTTALSMAVTPALGELGTFIADKLDKNDEKNIANSGIYSLTHSLTHSLAQLLSHSLTYLLTHSLTHSFIHSFDHFSSWA